MSESDSAAFGLAVATMVCPVSYLCEQQQWSMCSSKCAFTGCISKRHVLALQQAPQVVLVPEAQHVVLGSLAADDQQN